MPCLLSRGVHGRIGDGNSTVLYGDPWLPIIWSCFQVRSSSILGGGNKVSALILPHGSWNITLINQNFHEDGKKAILTLLLSPTQPPDVLTWHYT